MTTTCPECGTELQQATIDLAGTPDVDPVEDHARAEFDAQHMAAVAVCPNPDCPRHGRPSDADEAGARV